jgi:ABC-type multidrug transport system ATPase subunit
MRSSTYWSTITIKIFLVGSILESAATSDLSTDVINEQNGFQRTTTELIDDSVANKDSAEIFPLLFSIIVFAIAVVFSIWVIANHAIPFNGHSEVTDKEQQKLNCRAKFDSEVTDREQQESNSRPDPRSAWFAMPQSSWVGRSQSLLHSLTNSREIQLNELTKIDEEEMDENINSIVGDGDEETATCISSQNKLNNTLISWSQVSCAYSGKNSSDTPIVTLKNCFGHMQAMELTAIMGASGCGKSTLLDILSGRKTLGNITGKLSVLGHEIENIKGQAINDNSELRSVAAYVPQQEALFPTQTAEEAVAFAANLKLGRDPRGDHVRRSRIESVLQEVGLSPESCKRPIGGELSGGVVLRGLSGGERKRLAVACALALKPKLLFLDEITSGLDSENALAITKLLKSLCSSKKVAAMMVIHQPNAKLFQEFDRLILLREGTPIFSDKTSELPNLYQNIFQKPMPEWYDLPSDLMAQISDLRDNAMEPDMHNSNELVPTSPVMSGNHPDPPSAIWKFKVVFQRNLTSHYVRDLTNLTSRLGLYGATALIDGLLFWQVADIDSDGSDDGVNSTGVAISTVVGALTFLILVSYLLPFAMIPIFVHDKKFFLAESALGMYSPWLYCMCQILLETWVIVLAATIETCVVVPMCGLWNPSMDNWETFFTILGILIASGLAGSVLVLFNAIYLPSQDLAFLSGSGLITIGLAVSGGFVLFPSMKSFISWVQWLSPCKYTLQALATTIFKGTPYEDYVNTTYAFDNPETISGNLGALLMFFLGFSGSAMVALARQRETR